MAKQQAGRSDRLRAALRARPYLPTGGGRIEAIDLARGIAIGLMILSHGVSGLLGIRQVPDWGMVPIHLITKFSSSLFILVFGIALAVAFLPHADAEDWPRRRMKLWLRALVVLFWYKILTVVEMLPLYQPQDIVDTLLYRRFPIWVEILGFYAIALLWVPLILPVWKRAPLWGRLASPVLMALLAYLLGRYSVFGDNEPLQALLIEHDDHYTWGQLSRGPLVLVGLLIGEAVLRCYWKPDLRWRLVKMLAGAGGVLLLTFFALAAPALGEQLMAVARNVGKHPPELMFMLFSVGGALVILALALLGGERLASWLRPITLVGTDALKAFIFHIVAIFLVMRYLFEMWQVFSYPQVLGISLALIVVTGLWIRLTTWIKVKS
ncbi:heparan-alpha-glucosaminide N-acetyltransferase domain-containing protein [Litchfieldella qijiaojingensis]|nr:heparan-alpha-glucosaminide N-acetyltransferase domain-containing protein [Halomonas qijiaojingensis]